MNLKSSINNFVEKNNFFPGQSLNYDQYLFMHSGLASTLNSFMRITGLNFYICMDNFHRRYHTVPVYLKKSEIDKAKISWLSKEITIRDKRLPKKYIQFSVPEMINQDPDNVVIPVKQNEEAKRFAEFFKKSYSKWGLKSNLLGKSFVK